MGLFFSKAAPENPRRDSPAPASDCRSRIMVKTDDFFEHEIKAIILGPGDSGKTTYWRQLRNLYANGLTEDEKVALIPLLRISIIEDMKRMVAFANESSIYLPEQIRNEISYLESIDAAIDDIVPEIADAISKLWECPVIQKVYEQASFLCSSDHSSFFLDKVKEIFANDYYPSPEDIIKSRIRTTGINELRFLINDKKVILADIGGQKCERNKWKVLQGINVVIFVVSLSDFNQMLFEEKSEGRTEDSIQLFEATIKSKGFSNLPLFLVFNKVDEFRKKFCKYPDSFRKAYPMYQGEMSDPDAAIQYIISTYKSRIPTDRPENAHLYTYVTCAVDMEEMRSTFEELALKMISI